MKCEVLFPFVFGLCLLYGKCFFTSVDVLGSDFSHMAGGTCFLVISFSGNSFFFSLVWSMTHGSAFNFCCITGNAFCLSLIAGKCFFPSVW